MAKGLPKSNLTKIDKKPRRKQLSERGGELNEKEGEPTISSIGSSKVAFLSIASSSLPTLTKRVRC